MNRATYVFARKKFSKDTFNSEICYNLKHNDSRRTLRSSNNRLLDAEPKANLKTVWCKSFKFPWRQEGSGVNYLAPDQAYQDHAHGTF